MNQLFYNIAGGIVHQSDAKNGQQYQKWLLHFTLGQWDESWRRWCRASFSVVFPPHLRTLAQEKRSQNCLRFGPSLCLYPLLSRNIIFLPALTMAARAKKILAKRFVHAISVHYRDFEHAYIYWIWLRYSASYVIIKNWFMLSARISSYGCTREVWRAREKRMSCSRRSREHL